MLPGNLSVTLPIVNGSRGSGEANLARTFLDDGTIEARTKARRYGDRHGRTVVASYDFTSIGGYQSVGRACLIVQGRIESKDCIPVEIEVCQVTRID